MICLTSPTRVVAATGDGTGVVDEPPDLQAALPQSVDREAQSVCGARSGSGIVA
jgi:hypothetical protein